MIFLLSVYKGIDLKRELARTCFVWIPWMSFFAKLLYCFLNVNIRGELNCFKNIFKLFFISPSIGELIVEILLELTDKLLFLFSIKF